jgi:hypothetical protein
MRDAGTRDELGLGAIRDSFSNTFFPGTTVIQTRARYFLFVPWIYHELEKDRVPSAKTERKARKRELALIRSLKAGGETQGVIGRQAGDSLLRLPSEIYWPGLCKWDIFRPGYSNYVSRDIYHGSIEEI